MPCGQHAGRLPRSRHPGDHASDAGLDVRRGPDRVQAVGSGPGPLEWRR